MFGWFKRVKKTEKAERVAKRPAATPRVARVDSIKLQPGLSAKSSLLIHYLKLTGNLRVAATRAGYCKDTLSQPSNLNTLLKHPRMITAMVAENLNPEAFVLKQKCHRAPSVKAAEPTPVSKPKPVELPPRPSVVFIDRKQNVRIPSQGVVQTWDSAFGIDGKDTVPGKRYICLESLKERRSQ